VKLARALDVEVVELFTAAAKKASVLR